MSKRSKRTSPRKPKTDLVPEKESDESDPQTVARMMLGPHVRHALAASGFGDQALGGKHKGLSLSERMKHMQTTTAAAETGDLAICSQLLAAQAVTLDNMFAELARRAAKNMGEYMDATERYGRLALKAQSNCRATLEALARLHQPREQTVRHVHVNEGGQAIVADQLNYCDGGKQNGKSVEQSHATGTASGHAALPCPDTPWQGVPITGSERSATMQNARGDKSRRT